MGAGLESLAGLREEGGDGSGGWTCQVYPGAPGGQSASVGDCRAFTADQIGHPSAFPAAGIQVSGAHGFSPETHLVGAMPGAGAQL